MWVAPSQTEPPIGCSLCYVLVCPKMVGKKRTELPAIANIDSCDEEKIPVPNFRKRTRDKTTEIPPSVPPTAINPKSRLPCDRVKTSAMNAQNIVVAKRLKTLTQMKNMAQESRVPALPASNA